MQDLVSDVMHGPVENGDTAGVAALYPKMEEVSQTLQHVTLPENMAAVQKDFDRARKELGKAMEVLGMAVGKKDSVAILDAAVGVHHAVSRLDAAASGTCYELVLLHDVIAPIQHRALPDEDWPAIAAAVPELRKRMQDLKEAQLPERSKDLKPKLVANADAMLAATDDLEKACVAEDGKAITEAFGRIHDSFHSCMEMFQ